VRPAEERRSASTERPRPSLISDSIRADRSTRAVPVETDVAWNEFIGNDRQPDLQPRLRLVSPVNESHADYGTNVARYAQ